jgi:phage terminase large subunit-like protein
MLAQNLHSSSITRLPASQRKAILAQLTEKEAEALLYDWTFWAREKQVTPPGNWQFWVLLAGRGFGKTRTGAEWIRESVEHRGCRRIALVARTAADCRDVMVEGESGILAISPPWFKPKYEPSKRRLTWPNGAIATTYSADEPDLLRGPQHDGAWCDELASWRYAEAWDNLMFGLRLGNDPRCVVTTTPKPVKLLRDVLNNPAAVITRGSTYENRANLAPAFFNQIVSKYEKTRIGLQELFAVLLDDAPGALWKRQQIEDLRVTSHPALKRIVVAIDPPASSEEGSNEAGIVVAGLGENKHGYVLDDLSLIAKPKQWADQAIAGFNKYEADRIIAEKNNGGDLVESNIRAVDPDVPVKLVWASRGKQTRAEPIASLYERGLVHHVGMFGDLETQMCNWEPGTSESPDRLDALVWALTELMLPDKSGAKAARGQAVGMYGRR